MPCSVSQHVQAWPTVGSRLGSVNQATSQVTSVLMVAFDKVNTATFCSKRDVDALILAVQRGLESCVGDDKSQRLLSSLSRVLEGWTAFLFMFLSASKMPRQVEPKMVLCSRDKH